MAETTTILVIEDDASIRRGLVDALSFAGYTTLDCSDGGAAVNLALESNPDLVLLDVMLPHQNGFDILTQLREARPTLPIIMVTARGSETDRVQGLRGGADDYVVKPFSATELLARVEAVLRRSPGRTADAPQTLFIGDMTIDLARCETRRDDDSPESLTEREAAILDYLAQHRDRAVNRDELLQHVWGLNPRGLQTRTVDVHIMRLREKLPDDCVVTVRGKGYMLGADVEVGS